MLGIDGLRRRNCEVYGLNLMALMGGGQRH